MSYLDLYKRNLKKNGSTTNETRQNMAKRNLELNFSIGSLQGHLQRPNVDELEAIDFIVNSSADILKKELLFRPSADISVGNYVVCGEDTFIIREIDKYGIELKTVSFLCNNSFNLKGVANPLPCYSTNTAFGTKGVRDDSQGHFMELDSKLRIYVQRNKYTECISLGHRLMFNNQYVYSITEIDDVVWGGMYVMTMSVTEKHPNDDKPNNLAWNETSVHPDEEINIDIIGSDSIVLGKMATYNVDTELTVEWLVDDKCEIVNVNGSQCTIKGNKKGWSDLTLTIGNQTIEKKIVIL